MNQDNKKPDWSKKPDWAEVWLEFSGSGTRSGWYMTGATLDNPALFWTTEHGVLVGKDHPAITVHYPPENEPTPEEPTTKNPPVGWHGECTQSRGGDGYWEECIVLPDNYLVVNNPLPNGSPKWFVIVHDDGGMKFRPLRSDKERWVQRAIKIDTGTGAENYYLFAEALYDAMKEGTLPVPGGGK